MTVVGTVLQVFAPQSLDRHGLEQPLLLQPRGRQVMFDETLKLLPQPLLDRDTEALFRAIYALMRNVTGGDALQQDLGSPLIELELRGKAKREFDDAPVEQWNASLDRARHRHAIDLGKAVIDQIAAEIDIQGLVSIVPVACLGPQRQDVGTDRGRNRLTRRFGKEPSAHGLVTEDAPAGVSPFRVQASALNEPFRLVDQSLLRRSRRQCRDQRFDDPTTQAGRYALPAAGLFVRQVCLVAAEQLVTAVTHENDLDVAACKLRDEIGRENGEVAYRIIDVVHQTVEKVEHLWPDDLDAMRQRKVPGNPTRPLGLVIARIVEPYAEGLRAVHRRDHDRAVDPARQECPERHVAHQLAADAVPDENVQFILPVGLGSPGCRSCRGQRIPESPDGHLPGAQVEVERSCRLESAHVAEHRSFARNVLPGQELSDCVHIEPSCYPFRGENHLDLGTENQTAGAERVIQGLDADASTTRARARSKRAIANMPRSCLGNSIPTSSQRCTITSVSDAVRKRCPRLSSIALSSR